MRLKQAREAIRQLLIDASVLPASSIVLGKHDAVDPRSLPIIRIMPSRGSFGRSSVDSFADTHDFTIQVDARGTASKDIDTTLEDFQDDITAAIRGGSTTLDELLHDYQVTDSEYEFDTESRDRVGRLSIQIETMLKP